MSVVDDGGAVGGHDALGGPEVRHRALGGVAGIADGIGVVVVAVVRLLRHRPDDIAILQAGGDKDGLGTIDVPAVGVRGDLAGPGAALREIIFAGVSQIDVFHVGGQVGGSALPSVAVRGEVAGGGLGQTGDLGAGHVGADGTRPAGY